MAKFRFPFFGKKETVEEKIEAILERRNISTLSPGVKTVDAKSLTVANILKTLKSKVLTAINGGSRGIFVSPEWDFSKTQLAFTNEAIFRRAVEKYVEQIRKHDWEFIGNNPNTVKYIRKRFDQIATVTNKPTSEFFDEFAFNLVLYSNALVVKRRNRKASGGKTRTTFDGYKRIPVAGYELVDPSTILVDKDEYGNPKKWRQLRHGTILNKENGPSLSELLGNPSAFPDKFIEWPSYNMIHVKDRGASPSTYFFAMPMATPVIADMQALRELEELVLLESIKVAVPKLHAKVGSKDMPGTQEQVNDLGATIRHITGDGVLVTTERVEIADIAKATSANNILTASIDYFRARVLAGLGMSGIAMGEGDSANRSTAQVLQSEMQSTSAKFQRIIKRGIEFHIIRELLYESGYSEFTLDEENMVYLSIPEVDLSEKIRREAHYLNLYVQNSVTEDELRKELGRDIIGDADRDGMFLNLVSIPLADAQASAQAEGAIKKANSVASPTNQYGSKPKPRISRDEYLDLWDKCLKSKTKVQVAKAIKGSNLDPYDITILQLMVTDYLGTYTLKESVKLVFSALEERII